MSPLDGFVAALLANTRSPAFAGHGSFSLPASALLGGGLLRRGLLGGGLARSSLGGRSLAAGGLASGGAGRRGAAAGGVERNAQRRRLLTGRAFGALQSLGDGRRR